MSVYKVDICGVTTSKLPVLKDDEKEELFEKIKKGDKAAREKYIRGNLRLVLSVIRRFSNHNENMDDLFQIGCIGLMKSIDNFDPVYTDGGDTLYVMDQISDKKNKEEAWVKNLVLDDALKLLDDRARQIIKLRFFEGKTQIEVAEEINISQAQVSRLEKNALKNMHGYLEA